MAGPVNLPGLRDSPALPPLETFACTDSDASVEVICIFHLSILTHVFRYDFFLPGRATLYSSLRARPDAQPFLTFVSIAYDWRLGTGDFFYGKQKSFGAFCLHYTRCALRFVDIGF